MPWCEECERFSNPNTLDADGGCPSCGTVIAEAREPEGTDDAGLKSIPWHFWLLLVAVVIYLGWRLIEGVVWVAGRF